LALTIAGGVVEPAGLVVAIFGIRRTWAEFRNPDERFFAPVTAGLDRVTLWLNRLFRHRLPPRTVEL
jgi:hypothetical protein